MVERMSAEGASAAESAELADVIWDHVVNFETDKIAFSTVCPGDELRCGRWCFEVVSAPGHTTGQCVLWEPETRTAFLGDAVLFLCSTCIGFWGEGEDPIGEQLGTLRALARRGIEHAFMGHGLQEGDVSERCLANVGHHERRSARALAAIAERPGQTGFELVPRHGLARALRPLGRDPGHDAVVPRLREHRAPGPPRRHRGGAPRAWRGTA